MLTTRGAASARWKLSGDEDSGSSETDAHLVLLHLALVNHYCLKFAVDEEVEGLLKAESLKDERSARM